MKNVLRRNRFISAPSSKTSIFRLLIGPESSISDRRVAFYGKSGFFIAVKLSADEVDPDCEVTSRVCTKIGVIDCIFRLWFY